MLQTASSKLELQLSFKLKRSVNFCVEMNAEKWPKLLFNSADEER